jgi:hypothetical protein
MQGRLVQILRDENQDSGEYEIAWDGSAANGTLLNSGTYYCVLEAEALNQTFRQATKMLMNR